MPLSGGGLPLRLIAHESTPEWHSAYLIASNCLDSHPIASVRIPLPRFASHCLGSQGHLFKKGRRVPSWKRRYFCLCDGELFYYYAAEMSNPFQPLGVISVSGGSSPSASIRAFGKSDSGAELSSGAHYGSIAPDGGASAAAPAHASAHHGGAPGAAAAVAHGSSGGGTNGGHETSNSAVLGNRAVLGNSAGARPTPLIIQPHGDGENSLPRHYSFAVHTSNRTYVWLLMNSDDR